MKKLILLLLLLCGCSNLGEYDVYLSEYKPFEERVIHLKRDCVDNLIYGDIRKTGYTNFCSKCVSMSEKKRLEEIIENNKR